MNIQLSAQAFATEEEQRAGAIAVRKRLMGRPNQDFSVNSLRARAVELQQALIASEEENMKLRDTVTSLRLDLADLRASFMSQAKHLAGLQDKLAGETSYTMKERKSVTRIVAEVLKDYPGISWEDVLSVRRARALIEPRHACMRAVCDQRPDLSFPAVGRIFQRDHTSILWAVKKSKTKGLPK